MFNHNLDDNGVEIIDPSYKGEYICFVDGVMQTYTYISGLDKPYLKIHISNIDPITGNEMEIPSGQKIQIPILTEYQPTDNEIVSVWYNYVPYQGILDSKQKKLRRLSNWKYFVSTLSSGNVNDEFNKKKSICNLINRLPGGSSSASSIVGQDINLKSHNFSNFESIEQFSLNKNLIFIDQTYIGSKNKDVDSAMFDLDTEYYIYKNHCGMQDDFITINDKEFKTFLPLLENAINKYCGMSCVVADEFGDLYILVIGDVNNLVPSISNAISPKFGDLFIIQDRPNFINRKNLNGGV